MLVIESLQEYLKKLEINNLTLINRRDINKVAMPILNSKNKIKKKLRRKPNF